MNERLRLLRNGFLSDIEVADLAADLGTANHIEARADVEKMLSHPLFAVRFNALATLAYEWGVASNTDRIVEIALTDPDEDCRRQAAGALGSLFRGTQNKDVLAVLVSIVRDSNKEKDLRSFSYTSALDVIGVARSIQPNPMRLTVGPDELAALDDYLKAL